MKPYLQYSRDTHENQVLPKNAYLQSTRLHLQKENDSSPVNKEILTHCKGRNILAVHHKSAELSRYWKLVCCQASCKESQQPVHVQRPAHATHDLGAVHTLLLYCQGSTEELTWLGPGALLTFQSILDTAQMCLTSKPSLQTLNTLKAFDKGKFNMRSFLHVR